MKVRVCYTINVDDDYRMALSHQFGDHGVLASREDVKNYARNVGSANDEDLMAEWQECDEGCQPDDA